MDPNETVLTDVREMLVAMDASQPHRIDSAIQRLQESSSFPPHGLRHEAAIDQITTELIKMEQEQFNARIVHQPPEIDQPGLPKNKAKKMFKMFKKQQAKNRKEHEKKTRLIAQIGKKTKKQFIKTMKKLSKRKLPVAAPPPSPPPRVREKPKPQRKKPKKAKKPKKRRRSSSGDESPSSSSDSSFYLSSGDESSSSSDGSSDDDSSSSDESSSNESTPRRQRRRKRPTAWKAKAKPKPMKKRKVPNHGLKSRCVKSPENVATETIESEMEESKSELLKHVMDEQSRLREENSKLKNQVDEHPLSVGQRIQARMSVERLGLVDLQLCLGDVEKQLEVIENCRNLLNGLKSDLETRVEAAKQEPKEGDESLSEDENVCVVCMDEVPTHALVPCGHRCIGQNCIGVVTECPMCRKSVESAIKIFDV